MEEATIKQEQSEIIHYEKLLNLPQVSIKISIQRNLADVGMAQEINAPADKVHTKLEVPHTVICTL